MTEPINLTTTRRDFLKTSAAFAATTAVAGTLLRPGAVHAAGDDTIKVALVGCGGRGGGAAVNALSTKGPVKLVAVADAFEDNARNTLANLKAQFSDKMDVPDDRVFAGFDAYQKAIDSGCDLVILATPPGFRPIHFEYAVKQGKHVFMEKPVASDAPGVRQVILAADEAKKKNLKVGVGLQRHHDPRYIETVKRIQGGAIGDVILLRAYWNDDGVWVRPRQQNQTEMEYQMRNWYYFTWLCGDHIVEQHIHNLDVCNWVKNAYPATAQGQGGRQVRTGMDHGEIFDHHMVEFTYPDGTVLLSQCRHQPDCWKSVSEHAHGSTGVASAIAEGRIVGKDGSKWEYQGPGAEPYQAEHDDLFDAIRNDRPYNEADYGAKSTMTAILGRMATYSGQLIKWDDAINSSVSLMPKEFTFQSPPPVLPGPDGRYPVATPGVTKVL